MSVPAPSRRDRKTVAVRVGSLTVGGGAPVVVQSMTNTDTADAPWTIIKSDDKKRARLNCMQHFLSGLDYPDKDSHVVHGPDPLIVGSSGQVISKDQHLWS